MGILVQKFGGTSLSNQQARTFVINHIKKARSENNKLVIVVSAMGRRGDPYATDTLLEWIQENGSQLPSREKDMLLGCGEIISAATLCSLLNKENIPTVILNGAQAGILTNNQYGNAQILSIDPQRILQHLDQNQVVIVPGFQGITEYAEITTLGRGGSDTTATALGAALKADFVDIYTDVDGILTADPRIVEDAQPLSHVTYNEICHMANHGAKVIHPRSVEIAMQANIPVRVRSTFSDGEGTLVAQFNHIESESKMIKDRYVTGIAHVPDITQIQVFTQDGQYDLHLKVFKSMAQHEISVDFINVNPSGVVYTVFDYEAKRAIDIIQQMGYEPKFSSQCAKVSIIGGGINGVPGIMARIVESLTEEDIQILQSADSNTTIWVLVRKEDMIKAVQALHRKFGLHNK